MDFRRSGQLDERRRRVLRDEIASPTDAGHSDEISHPTASQGPVRAYAPAVLEERQARVTDLVPLRPLWVAVLILLGLTGVAAIETLHIHAATAPVNNASPYLAALDVREPGNVAAWYASALLAGGAALALIVFGVRAHRIDDYRGRYRVWLWTAAALGWLSLDAATNLHNALALGITLLAGRQVPTTSLAAGCTITWLAVYSLALGTLGIRLAIEIWPSAVSFASLMLAGTGYLLAGLIELKLLGGGESLVASVVESSVALLAHVSLVTAIGLYARHVCLDAAGRLKVHIDPDKKQRAKSRAKLKVVKDEKASDEAPQSRSSPAKDSEPAKFKSVGSPASTGVKNVPTIAKGSLVAPDDNEDDDDEEDYGDGKLSKAERRRLKKVARRDQQRRAA